MSIGNYTALIAAVGDWLDRDDLAARVPTFIQLTEARLNRILDDPEMEVTATATAEDGEVSLPEDFGEMVSLSTGDGRLGSVGPAEFSSFRQMGGTPRYFSISDGVISFAPSTVSAVTMVYRRRIPALTVAAPTNWLLNLAPDVYLYGSLVQAEGFLAEDDRVAGWKAMFDEAIAELRMDGQRRKWGAGPISPRINRP